MASPAPWGPGGLAADPVEEDDDESRCPLEKIVDSLRKSGMRTIQRMAHVEGMAAAARAAAYEQCALLYPALEELLADAEPEVAAAALQQLPTLGELLHAKDAGRAAADLQRCLLPLLLPLALHDNEAVLRGAVVAYQRLAALLPRDAAASAAQAAISALDARGAEDAAVAAARVFAHTAASWSEAALRARAPELLRRWCGHRDFAVREAIACCMSLVADALPLDVWRDALLPWFSQLCRDNNWRVRRAAALDLPRLVGMLHRLQQRLDAAAAAAAAAAEGGCGGAAACGGACRCDRAAREGGSRCSVCAACSFTCGACGEEGAATPRCPVTGAGISPLGDAPLGGCSHIGAGAAAAASAGAADDRHSRQPRHYPRRHGARGVAFISASLPASVWSAHARRPAGAKAPGAMAGHPLSSSLVVDEPPALGSAPPSPRASESSSLSSSDDRPLAGSPGPASPRGAEARGECEDAGGGAADGGAKAAAAPPADGEVERPPCPLAEQQPALHACWAVLRSCVDCTTADSSHWVKVTALSGLGPCLLALPPCQLSGLLVGRFVATGSSTTVIYDMSPALACAQSLGAVASRLGARHWPDVRGAFVHLQGSRDPAVLQELVAGLPFMARHLGTPILQTELLPALLTLAHDHLPWIDAALVAAAPPLLEALPRGSHDALLRVLSKLAHGAGGDGERCRSWRLRRDIAAQLGRLARAAGRPAVVDLLWPALIALAADPVAAVRDAAAAQVGPLLAALLPLLVPDQEQAAEAAQRARGQGPQRQQEQPRPLQERQQACEPGASPSAGNEGSADSAATGAQGSGPEAEPSQSESGESSGSGRSSFESGGSHDAGDPAGDCADTASSGLGGFGGYCGGAAAGGGGFEEEGGFLGGLPCALSAPPCGGLPCALSAPPCDGLPSSLAPPEAAPLAVDHGEACGDAPASGSSRSRRVRFGSGEAPAAQRRPAVASPRGSADSSGSEGESSDSEATGGGSGPTSRSNLPPRSPMHPALVPVGSWSSQHPGMAPVGSRSSSSTSTSTTTSSGGGAIASSAPVQHHSRCASVGAMPGTRGALATPHGPVRRRATTGRLGGGVAGASECGFDPLCVSPSQYVDCLVQRFGRSSSFQGRQLFVTMGLGLLAHAAPLLPRRKREMVASALEALAEDSVAGVRVAAEGAAAALRAAAVERAAEGRAAAGGGAAGAAGACGAGAGAGCVVPDGGRTSDGGEPPAAAALPAAHQHLLHAARALARARGDSFEAAAAALCGRRNPLVQSTAPIPIDV
ncbi:hypothetical protein Rsub_02078 [Raphidocelis subcapitata]|uniref:TOG domain-containing protein n=1 Tax=Raphidocelis subcapitata TaxID=307507 RepID=A0A2V0NPH6_9CHLO|nr:hypothetical protein Rsub_02078 [Raphidocelis subcapitata]|eukprot:GBF89506.1 hypothetical protein Rsub_02078 [Raphidocelis subcapitata]